MSKNSLKSLFAIEFEDLSDEQTADSIEDDFIDDCFVYRDNDCSYFENLKEELERVNKCVNSNNKE